MIPHLIRKKRHQPSLTIGPRHRGGAAAIHSPWQPCVTSQSAGAKRVARRGHWQWWAWSLRRASAVYPAPAGLGAVPVMSRPLASSATGRGSSRGSETRLNLPESGRVRSRLPASTGTSLGRQGSSLSGAAVTRIFPPAAHPSVAAASPRSLWLAPGWGPRPPHCSLPRPLPLAPSKMSNILQSAFLKVAEENSGSSSHW